jgi:hypothetical protein
VALIQVPGGVRDACRPIRSTISKVEATEAGLQSMLSSFAAYART